MRESGINNSVVLGDDPKTARDKRIRNMQKFATERRKSRAWERINSAIENDEDNLIKKIEEFDSKKPNRFN